jgi:hypothetical protein
VSITQERGEQEALRNACWIGGTTILSTSALMEVAVAATSKEQGGVGRGCRFLKDPLCLAEFRVWARGAETHHTIPDQVHKPTADPTMRRVFQYGEGVALLPLHASFSSRTPVVQRQPVHQLLFSLLGPSCEQCSFSSR